MSTKVDNCTAKDPDFSPVSEVLFNNPIKS